MLRTARYERCPWERIVHWHHTCWQCGADHCGFGRDWYLCHGCLCEERADYAPTQVHQGFDPDFAASCSSPG